MLAQKFRFHGHGSLRYLYKNGDSVRTHMLTLKYIANPRRKTSRYTVVVGKKIIKSAVKRNYVRRRLYEIIRLEEPTLKSGYDIALMVFSAEIFSIDSPSLTKLVKQLLSQADLYK